MTGPRGAILHGHKAMEAAWTLNLQSTLGDLAFAYPIIGTTIRAINLHESLVDWRNLDNQSHDLFLVCRIVT